MPEYAAQAEEAFALVREQFEETLGWLAGAEAGALEHGELEDQLGGRGRELVRLMFQGQLDLRAVREQRPPGRDRPGREGADTGGERSRQAAGHGIRCGHGEPDRLPGARAAERARRGRGAEPAGGEVLAWAAAARGDRGAAGHLPGRDGRPHPRDRDGDRETAGRGACDAVRRRRGRLLRLARAGAGAGGAGADAAG